MKPILLPSSGQARRTQLRLKLLVWSAEKLGGVLEEVDKAGRQIGFSDDERLSIMQELVVILDEVVKERPAQEVGV